MVPSDVARPTRRSVLLGLGSGVVTGLGGTRLLPAPADLPDEQAPVAGPVDTPPDPRSEHETPYAVWQYRPTLLAGAFDRTLPINLVSPLETAEFADVIETFRAAGWRADIAEQPRFAYDRTAEAYVAPTWTGASSRYGIAGRLHVRCWHLADRLSVQAHVDTSPRPGHRISSFAVARETIERTFETAGWTVVSRHRRFGNDQAPDHDGDVSVITR